jgi:hypothetical protein
VDVILQDESLSAIAVADISNTIEKLILRGIKMAFEGG